MDSQEKLKLSKSLSEPFPWSGVWCCPAIECEFKNRDKETVATHMRSCLVLKKAVSEIASGNFGKEDDIRRN